MTTVWTVGHSNRSFEEFVALLEGQGIEVLVDVRAFPGSRKHPQFGKDRFADLLGGRGIDYRHMPALGGRRKLDPAAEPHIGGAWRNLSFRAYAQYAQTPQFRAAIDELVEEADRQRTVICCSEAVPWRCHRWIVSDMLAARRVEVLHLISPGAPRRHAVSTHARVRGTRVTWPADYSGIAT